jgi:hypothetical protein
VSNEFGASRRAQGLNDCRPLKLNKYAGTFFVEQEGWAHGRYAKDFQV